MWASDWSGTFYYQDCFDNTIINDPQGPATGTFSVKRGGSFPFFATNLRVALRGADVPTSGQHFDGCRCVLK